MAAQTGTSVLGRQVLLSAVGTGVRSFSVLVGSNPLPPAISQGYYFLYYYQNVSPFRCYVVDRDKLYAPGIYGSILVPDLGSTWFYRLDAIWNRAGINWTVNI